MNIRRTLSKNWFLIGLLLAVIISLTAPELGVSINYKGLSSTILVVLLFFVSGLSLPTESIRSGLSNVKLHLFLLLVLQLGAVLTLPGPSQYSKGPGNVGLHFCQYFLNLNALYFDLAKT